MLLSSLLLNLVISLLYRLFLSGHSLLGLLILIMNYFLLLLLFLLLLFGLLVLVLISSLHNLI